MPDYSNGLFGGIKDSMMSPLFLGGAGLLSGGGMQGLSQGFQAANDGQKYNEGQRKAGIEQQRDQQFGDLFQNGNSNQFDSMPPGLVALARVAGPDAGPAMLAKGYQGKMDLDQQGKLQAQSLGIQYNNTLKLQRAQQDQKMEFMNRLSAGDQAQQPPPQQAGPQPQQSPGPQPQQAGPQPRTARDGRQYVPDPNRPGKYLMVQP